MDINPHLNKADTTVRNARYSALHPVIPRLYVPEWKTDMKNRRLIVQTGHLRRQRLCEEAYSKFQEALNNIIRLCEVAYSKGAKYLLYAIGCLGLHRTPQLLALWKCWSQAWIKEKGNVTIFVITKRRQTESMLYVVRGLCWPSGMYIGWIVRPMNAELGGIPNYEHDEPLFLEKREQMHYNVETRERVDGRYAMAMRCELIHPPLSHHFARYRSSLMIRKFGEDPRDPDRRDSPR